MTYTIRAAEKTVKRYLKAFPVVGITGPRQSGKSTLLKHLLKDYTYVSFDDYLLVELFNDDPKTFIEKYDNKVIFDEVQYVPKLFHYINITVDNDRSNYGKFVLTGSTQFSFLNNISESLAGRIGLLSLLPFQFSEINEKYYQKELHDQTDAKLFYLKTSNGVEIDMITDRKASQELFEIKKSKTFKAKMLQPIKEFLSENSKGFLLYQGDSYDYTKKIQILNHKDYLIAPINTL